MEYFILLYLLPCWQHAEVPGPGIEPMLQQCPEPEQWQSRTLNQLNHQRILHGVYLIKISFFAPYQSMKPLCPWKCNVGVWEDILCLFLASFHFSSLRYHCPPSASLFPWIIFSFPLCFPLFFLPLCFRPSPIFCEYNLILFSFHI